MESGRFAGFFINAPFDKPGLLRGFRGCSPPLFSDPTDRLVKGGFWGLSREWQGLVREGQALMDGMPGWDFIFRVPGFFL